MPAPLSIVGLGKETIEVTWGPPDNHLCKVSAKTLRLRCRCAMCIDEITGEKRLDPNTVADGIRYDRIEQVGSYAIGVTFSDGHATGIFTFENLRGACTCGNPG